MWLARGVLALMVAACGDDDAPSGGSGSAGATSSGGSTGGSTEPQGSTEPDETSGGSPDCAGVGEGEPCSEPGAVCSYGDDCGSWVYECQGDAWVQIDGSGCGADPIPCDAMPEDGDPCGENQGEVCDPDGDCLNVLECDAYAWRFYEVCTEMYCAEASPQNAAPCEGGRFCNVEHECGVRTFHCRMGHWDFFGGAICDIPQPCSAAPVPNDACSEAGEVCPAPAEGFPALVCDGSTWQPQ